MTLAYRITTTPDDNGTLFIQCPALPEVKSFAESEAEVPAMAADAIEEALAARIASSEDIPASDASEDEGVTLPLLTELKVGLYVAARAQGVTRADLVRRLDWNRESVDRLFRLEHLSRVQQLDDAYRALGLAVHFNIEPARAMAHA